MSHWPLMKYPPVGAPVADLVFSHTLRAAAQRRRLDSAEPSDAGCPRIAMFWCGHQVCAPAPRLREVYEARIEWDVCMPFHDLRGRNGAVEYLGFELGGLGAQTEVMRQQARLVATEASRLDIHPAAARPRADHRVHRGEFGYERYHVGLRRVRLGDPFGRAVDSGLSASSAVHCVTATRHPSCRSA